MSLLEIFTSKSILSIKLDKQIIYKENIITDSLYKSATNKKIPANTIVDFARIYGFQFDFQRDIRKKDKFQIMYELFLNEKNEIVETGESWARTNSLIFGKKFFIDKGTLVCFMPNSFTDLSTKISSLYLLSVF